jgi:hypothetical protein
MKIEQEFNWYSNTVYEYFDNVQNSKLSFHLESGLSKNDTGMMNYTNTRLSVKIKDNQINQKVEFELSFDDVYILNTIIGSISKTPGKPPIPINSYTKNKQRQLVVYEPSPGLFNLSITDNSTIAKTLVVAFKKVTLAAMNDVISQLKSNWLILSSNAQSIVTTHSVLNHLEAIDKHITESNVIALHNTNNVKQPTAIRRVDPVTSVVAPPVVHIDNEFEPDLEMETSEYEDIDSTPVFDIDTSGASEAETDPPVGFVLDDNVLSSVSLTAAGESGTTDYTKRPKQVITPRPFINNFIEWNLDNIYQWVTGFVYCDQNSDQLTLTPLDLILTKSIGKHKYEFLTNNPHHYEFEYHILDVIKKAMKSYVETGKTKTTVNYYVDTNTIDKNNDIDLWNFTVDLTVLINVFKIFLINVNQLNLKSEESLEKTFNVKMAYIFLDTIACTFLSKINHEDTEQFTSDSINVFQQMSDRGSFDSILNTYSALSMGGKLQLNISMFKACADKFLEIQSNKDKVCIDTLNIGINGIEHIREKLETVIQKPKKVKSPQVKLFCKYLKNNDLDDSNYKDCYELLEFDMTEETNTDIIKVYGILRMNPNITKMIQLENHIDSKEQVEETPTVPEPTQKSEHEVFDIWDIDDSDESLFNLED